MSETDTPLLQRINAVHERLIVRTKPENSSSSWRKRNFILLAVTHAGLVKQEVLRSTFRASAGPRPLTQVEVGAFGCLKGCVEIAESTFNLSQTHGGGADIKKKIEALSEVQLESFYLQPRKVDARVLLSNPASHQQLIFDLLLLLLSFIRRTQLIITADPTHRRWRTLLSSSTSVHLDQCNEKISNLLHNKDLNPNKDTKNFF